MNDESGWRVWWAVRKAAIRHPRQMRRELAQLLRGMPWYADARPVGIIQHWVADPFVPITMCGRWAGERSTGEIRTLLGYHCQKCQRRVKRELRRREAAE